MSRIRLLIVVSVTVKSVAMAAWGRRIRWCGTVARSRSSRVSSGGRPVVGPPTMRGLPPRRCRAGPHAGWYAPQPAHGPGRRTRPARPPPPAHPAAAARPGPPGSRPDPPALITNRAGHPTKTGPAEDRDYRPTAAELARARAEVARYPLDARYSYACGALRFVAEELVIANQVATFFCKVDLSMSRPPPCRPISGRYPHRPVGTGGRKPRLQAGRRLRWSRVLGSRISCTAPVRRMSCTGSSTGALSRPRRCVIDSTSAPAPLGPRLASSEVTPTPRSEKRPCRPATPAEIRGRPV